MKRIFFLLLWGITIPFSLKSQLLDDFEDGNLMNNPKWWGQTEQFGVSNGQLQLQSSSLENEAFIFVSSPTSIRSNTVWSFKVQLDFAPSASNFAIIYLAASNPDFRAEQEGYYVKIGGISGNQDALELYRQDEDDHVLLLSGKAGAVGNAPAIANVQVKRSVVGEWELLTDYSGGNNFQSEGVVQDATYPQGAYAGIYCRYTSTRRESFFFDNFLIDPVERDQKPAEILGLEVVSSTELILSLDEAIQPDPALTTDNYLVSGNIGHPVEVKFEGNSFSAIRLILGRPLVDQTSYTLAIANLADYADNMLSGQVVFDYVDLQTPLPGDLIINEILFNPQTGGSDFIELFNLSEKVLDLNGLRMLNSQVESSNREKAINEKVILYPGEYLVVTPDPDDILTRYSVPDPKRILKNTLPTLEDKSGNITLLSQGVSLDSFDYEEDFHFSLLARRDGVSLERLSFTAPTNERGNWHSASSTVGFATPGYRNSQVYSRPAVLDGIVSVPNPRLSPDGDGFEDVLLVQYATDRPGYVLNIRIFDARGRLIHHLVRNELLAGEGTFKWDGFTNEFTKARVGIYILWFELFDASGKVEERKETVVVAGKL